MIHIPTVNNVLLMIFIRIVIDKSKFVDTVLLSLQFIVASIDWKVQLDISSEKNGCRKFVYTTPVLLFDISNTQFHVIKSNVTKVKNVA